MTDQVSTAELLMLISEADWQEFDEQDFEAFAGVISKRPMIAFDEELDLTYILDDQVLSIIDGEGKEKTFALTFTAF